MKNFLVCSVMVLVALATQPSHAAFVKFEGGLDEEIAWRSAVGSFVSENFEGFAVGDRISSLPNLGLIFDPLPDGQGPGIYSHGVDNVPLGGGPQQLANFPGNCCLLPPPVQFGDVGANVDVGVDLFGFGFWNGDPQGDAVLRVFDRSGNPIGIITAPINTGTVTNPSDSYAGFISTVPIGRLEWEGNAGDGWNHYDDMEASFAPRVPEPSTLALLGAGLLGVGALRRRA